MPPKNPKSSTKGGQKTPPQPATNKPEGLGESAYEAVLEDLKTVPNLPVKRKRGRPPKRTSNPKNDEVVETPPVKTLPGKPTKSAPLRNQTVKNSSAKYSPKKSTTCASVEAPDINDEEEELAQKAAEGEELEEENSSFDEEAVAPSSEAEPQPSETDLTETSSEKAATGEEHEEEAQEKLKEKKTPPKAARGRSAVTECDAELGDDEPQRKISGRATTAKNAQLGADLPEEEGNSQASMKSKGKDKSATSPFNKVGESESDNDSVLIEEDKDDSSDYEPKRTARTKIDTSAIPPYSTGPPCMNTRLRLKNAAAFRKHVVYPRPPNPRHNAEASGNGNGNERRNGNGKRARPSSPANDESGQMSGSGPPTKKARGRASKSTKSSGRKKNLKTAGMTRVDISKSRAQKRR